MKSYINDRKIFLDSIPKQKNIFLFLAFVFISIISISALSVSAKEIGGTYYVNNELPTIIARFQEPVIVDYAVLTDSDQYSLRISNNPIIENDGKQYTYTVLDELLDGQYTFTIFARDLRGNPMTSAKVVNMSVDTVPPELVAHTPKKNIILTTTTNTIELNFSEKVILKSILLDGVDITKYFKSKDNMSYMAEIEIPDGYQSLIVDVMDFAQNNFTATYSFNVNAVPTVIELVSPRFGVANSTVFDFTVSTDEFADCGFSQIGFDSASPTTKNTTLHSWKSQLEPELITTHYVRCNDTYDYIQTKSFDISVDITPPDIDVSATPEMIINYPLQSTISITSDDDVACRYSNSSLSYSQMEYAIENKDENIKEDYSKELSQMISGLKDGSRYTYYVSCKNLAGLVSATKTVSFEVKTNTVGTMTINYPIDNMYTDKTAIEINVSTNFFSKCKFGRKGTAMSYMGDPSVLKLEHTSGTIVHDSGVYTYIVNCSLTHQDAIGGIYLEDISKSVTFTVDTTPPSVPVVDDKGPIANDSEHTYYLDKLWAGWSSEDNESGIKEYNYSIWQKPTYGTPVLFKDWTITGSDSLWVNDLSLNNSKTYLFRVFAINKVGLQSDTYGESNGITVDITTTPPSCNNGIRDQNESDIDCGGPCSACIANKLCNSGKDCSSGNCVDGKCQAEQASCDDQKKNGDETDIDCGGTCNKCEEGLMCVSDSDCLTNFCNDGMCIDKCKNGILDTNEGDIDCGTYCPNKCAINQSCVLDSDCETSSCINSTCTIQTIIIDYDADDDGINDSEDNCPNDYNPDQKNMDSDSYGDVCDPDADGDNIPDSWEKKMGLNSSNKDDAYLDPDGDGLTNKDEFDVKDKWGKSTDPDKPDTDGDGYNDKIEMDAGSDPTDPTSVPEKSSSSFLTILWIILLILLILGGGYYYYENYYKKDDKPQPGKPGPQLPNKNSKNQHINISQGTRRPLSKIDAEKEKVERQRQQRMLAMRKKLNAQKAEKLKVRRAVFDSFSDDKKASLISTSKGPTSQELKHIKKMHEFSDLTDKKIDALKGISLTELKRSKDPVNKKVYDHISRLRQGYSTSIKNNIKKSIKDNFSITKNNNKNNDKKNKIKDDDYVEKLAALGTDSIDSDNRKSIKELVKDYSSSMTTENKARTDDHSKESYEDYLQRLSELDVPSNADNNTKDNKKKQTIRGEKEILKVANKRLR